MAGNQVSELGLPNLDPPLKGAGAKIQVGLTPGSQTGAKRESSWGREGERRSDRPAQPPVSPRNMACGPAFNWAPSAAGPSRHCSTERASGSTSRKLTHVHRGNHAAERVQSFTFVRITPVRRAAEVA